MRNRLLIQPARRPAKGAGKHRPKSSRKSRAPIPVPLVGNVQSSNEVLSENAPVPLAESRSPRPSAPWRASSRSNIAQVKPSGSDGVVTAGRCAQRPPPMGRPLPLPGKRRAPSSVAKATFRPGERRTQTLRSEAQATEAPGCDRPSKTSDDWGTGWRGTRRTMARVMSESHKSVVPTHPDGRMPTFTPGVPGKTLPPACCERFWAGAQAEPGLNAWFDGDNNMRYRAQEHACRAWAVDTAGRTVV